MRESEWLYATNFILRGLVAVALAGGVIVLAGLGSNASGKSKLTGTVAVAGPARVIDGDTIDVGRQRVRLEGIDAPERSQKCPRKFIGSWRCGRSATRALERAIDGRRVVCISRGHDKYGRMLGVCHAGENELNAWMVANGYAWAFVKYSASYVSEEEKARERRVGIWTKQGAVPAWEYRVKKWRVSEQHAPGGCPIKGNISKNGKRIYHAPWSAWYSKVRIDEDKGERWFCSEAQARAAGWRVALPPSNRS